MRVLANPVAGSFPGEERLRAWLPGDADLVITRDRAHLCDSVVRGERLVICGGDGSLRDVVQTLSDQPGGTTLGLVPAGTGNDLARTLGLPEGLEQAVALAVEGDARPIDAMEMTVDGERFYGLNAAVGGAPSEASAQLDQGLKKVLGPLSFVVSGAQALMDLQPVTVHLTLDGDNVSAEVLTLGIANGQSCAGGVTFAPTADPSDGWLEVMLLHPGDPVDYAELAAKLANEAPDESGIVTRYRARNIAVDADRPMPFNLDGELIGHTPLTVRVLPGHLSFVRPPQE